MKFHHVKQRMGKWEKQRDQNSGDGQQKSGRTMCHVPLQESIDNFFLKFFLSNPSHDLTKFLPVPVHMGRVPVCVHGSAARSFWSFLVLQVVGVLSMLPFPDVILSLSRFGCAQPRTAPEGWL